MKLEQIEHIPSNYYTHRKEALLWVQKISGKLWTDYNTHDPGVTLIESLAYILTEIEYKLDFSIEDLLLSSTLGKDFQFNDNALLRAEEIFHTAPVTLKDFKILLIDRIKNINNAWLILNDAKSGSFNLLIQLKEDSPTQKTISKAKKLFEQYKIFGWSLNEISVIEQKEAQLSGRFYFQSEHSAEKMLAKILYEFNEVLINVEPESLTFNQLIEENQSIDRIFSGPKTKNGFLRDRDLKAFNNVLNLQEVKRSLNEVEGLMVLSNFSIRMGDQVYDKKMYISNTLPYIEPAKQQDITVYRDNKLVEINYEEVDYQYNKLRQDLKRAYSFDNTELSSFELSIESKKRKISQFHRALNELPTIYKANDTSIGGKQLYNEQLKKLLIPYEQFLANIMKQIGETSTFFSIHHPSLDYNQEPIKDKEIPLNKLEKSPMEFLKKRNKMLNHLLARFDYQLSADLPDLYYGDHPKSLEQRIKCKEILLQNMSQISSNKGNINLKNAENISFLEQEILLRLWIDKAVPKPISKELSDIGISINKLDDDGKIEVTEYLDKIYEGSLSEKERRFYLHAKRPLENLMRSGIKQSNYSIVKLNNEKKHGLFLSLGDKSTRNLLRKSKSKKRLRESISNWIQRFLIANKKSEGFYIVDNSNLISGKLKAAYTVTFIFPSWSSRFQTRSFQQHAEEIIFNCMPAHLRIHIAWLSFEEMLLFEGESIFEENGDIQLFPSSVEDLLIKKLNLDLEHEQG